MVGLHLTSPFGCLTEPDRVAKNLGIPLIIKEKGELFLDTIENPKYGYGSQMNPCIDCRILMFELAEQVRIEQTADFIVTGEVVGQRPFSQNKGAMQLIDKNSKMDEMILRPLSGGNLPATLPEKRGWIQRGDLLKFSGRGRSEQLALAKKLGVTDFSSPGGGCLLTEKAFSDRLKDFHTYPTYKTPKEKLAQASLLRVGRHFRLSEKTKVIVARSEAENEELHQSWKKAGSYYFKPLNFKGPSAVVLGSLDPSITPTIASLVARYGRKNDSEPYQLEKIESAQNNIESSEVLVVNSPTEDSLLAKWRIGIT